MRRKSLWRGFDCEATLPARPIGALPVVWSGPRRLLPPAVRWAGVEDTPGPHQALAVDADTAEEITPDS